jgi:hypothetical protein
MPGAPVRGTLKQGQFEVLVPGLLGEVGDDQAPRRRPSVGVASRTAPHDISAAFVISARVRSANRFSRPSGAPTGMIANGSAASPATSLATGSGSAASCSAVTAIWRAESKPPAICSTYSSVRSASSSARTCSALRVSAAGAGLVERGKVGVEGFAVGRRRPGGGGDRLREGGMAGLRGRSSRQPRLRDEFADMHAGAGCGRQVGRELLP